MGDLFTEKELQCNTRMGRLRACLSGEHHFRSTQELIYERMFDRNLNRLGIENDFAPIKSAANYSLLYLIERCISELEIRTVLELGAGQTTLLFNRLAEKRDLEVTTLEHDPHWQAHIQGMVRHQVRLAVLETKQIYGHPVQSYSKYGELPSPVDFLVVDGPVGTARWSRWGTLEIMEQSLGEDFVLLIDDVNRPGEMETANEALRILRQMGRDPKIGKTMAAKNQVILAAGRFQGAVYF